MYITPATKELNFRHAGLDPESIEETGCRIKSGMTNLEVFTCRCNS
jgi:hypothetical protein